MAVGVRQTKWLPFTGIAILPLHFCLDAITWTFTIYPFSQTSIYGAFMRGRVSK
jgi:hypothetical protein